MSHLVTHQTSADFVYSGQIVPILRLLDKDECVWLIDAYLCRRGELLNELMAIKDALDGANFRAVREILQKYES